jgi:hypothetical protein
MQKTKESEAIPDSKVVEAITVIAEALRENGRMVHCLDDRGELVPVSLLETTRATPS